MTLVSDIATECALMVRDDSNGELSTANWLTMIKSAAQDARISGWLIRLEDDDSLVIAEGQYEYDIPNDFAYISQIFIEETIAGDSVYIDEIPQGHWEVRLNVFGPTIYFMARDKLTTGRRLRLIGQKRPTIYTALTNTVDAGMDSFLRERALYFGFRFLGAGISELARWRQQMSIQAWQTSEMFLRRHPQEFRALPSGREVPGRG